MAKGGGKGFEGQANMKKQLLLFTALALAGAAQIRPLPSRSRSAAPAVTFNNQVARIFQKHCQVCHRPGDIGPFSLTTYAEAAPQARRIRTEVEQRRMPPWKPVAGFGEFLDERRLSQQEIDLIARWVELGAPEGDPRDLPPSLEFSTDWRLGPPDLVLEMPGEFNIPAGGDDIYRCFSIPMGLLQNRHITGFEVQPGNRSVVHHVVLFPDPMELSARLAAGDSQSSYSCFGGPGFPISDIIGAWAPGIQPQLLPPGIGFRVTAGSRAVLQVHYHPNGAPQTDRSRVGLYFARDAVQRDLQLLPIVNENFLIPPGASRHVVTASVVIPSSVRNAKAISILPHMHLLGREMRLEAVYPDGTRRPLIYIDDWDFDWQATYYYREPVPLPPLTRIELTAVFDNSEDNPRNPNRPPRAVRFGEQTTDEMCLALVWLVDQP